MSIVGDIAEELRYELEDMREDQIMLVQELNEARAEIRRHHTLITSLTEDLTYTLEYAWRYGQLCSDDDGDEIEERCREIDHRLNREVRV